VTGPCVLKKLKIDNIPHTSETSNLKPVSIATRTAKRLSYAKYAARVDDDAN